MLAVIMAIEWSADNVEHIILAALAIIPSTVAAVAAIKAAHRAKPVSNGWTEETTKTLTDQSNQLGRIEGKLDAHVKDNRAHRR
jgi:hypothetical protein